MKHAFYAAPLLLALARLASAQPAPVPGTPAATPAEQVPPPPTGETSPPPEVAPPVEGAPPPVEATPPAEPIPPTPPPPPPFTGLIPSSAGDQRLETHELALEKETTVPDHPFTASVFADYWFTIGPRVGGTVGMFRAFEAHLGMVLDSKTTMGVGTMPSTTESSRRIFYGITMGLLSYRGVQLAGGLTFLTGNGDASAMLPNGQLTVPLDAHWLPFRVPKTRVRITYPIGVGIEWGML